MESPKDFTSQAILDAGKTAPGALVCAYALMATLGPDHPLYLPMSTDTQLWADFSELPIMLSALVAGVEKPKLPIDVSPLAALCEQHRDDIGEGETWEYPFFYLELLAKERRLCPLFWARARWQVSCGHTKRIKSATATLRNITAAASEYGRPKPTRGLRRE